MFTRFAGATGLLLAVTLAANACAAWPDEGDKRPTPAPEPVTVRVENHNWSDIVVYAVHNGNLTVRLGLVPSMQDRSFIVPAAVVAGGPGISLLADPVGSNESYRSSKIIPWPGDEIQWELQNYLPLSILSLR